MEATPEEKARIAAIRKHEAGHKPHRHTKHHGRTSKATGSLLARAFNFLLVPGESTYPPNDIRRISEYLAANEHPDTVTIRAQRSGSLVAAATVIYEGVTYALTYSPTSLSYSAKVVPSA